MVPPLLQKKERKRRRMEEEVETQAAKLNKIRVNKMGRPLPPEVALQVSKIVKEVLKKDQRNLVYLVGGTARLYKGQQPVSRDIDIAIVAQKGRVYRELSEPKFKKTLEEITGREVDVIPFLKRHLKPQNILRELQIENKQGIYPLEMLAEGVPLYNVERARNIQQKIEPYLKMAYAEKERRALLNKQVRRSLLGWLFRKKR